MKLAVLNSNGIQTDLQGKKRYYYIVSDDYDFGGNSATDVTDIELMEYFFKLNRFDKIQDFIDTLKNYCDANGFGSLNSKEKEIMSRYFVATKSERDTIKTPAEQEEDAEEFSNYLSRYNNKNYHKVDKLINSDGVSTDLGIVNPTSLIIGGTLEIDSIIEATLTGDVDDWAPTDIGKSSVIKVNSTKKNAAISGITTGDAGRIIIIINYGSKPIKLLENSAFSKSKNRIRYNGTKVINKNSSVTLLHDGSMWQVIN
jgi:hypothetical protein